MPHTNLGLKVLHLAEAQGGGQGKEGVRRMERWSGTRERFIELIRSLSKSLNNTHIRTVGTEKIILDDENTIIKVNTNINYILELRHKLAIDLKGKYCSEIWLSHINVDFSKTMWPLWTFTNTLDQGLYYLEVRNIYDPKSTPHHPGPVSFLWYQDSTFLYYLNSLRLLLECKLHVDKGIYHLRFCPLHLA